MLASKLQLQPKESKWRSNILKPALFITSSLLTLSPIRFAFAESSSENFPSTYSSPKYHFSINVDSDFEKSPKLLQTHEFEVFFKSSKIKGLSFGVTVMSTPSVYNIFSFYLTIILGRSCENK